MVVDSRSSPKGIRRRRVCPQAHRFTTYENYQHDAMPKAEIAIRPSVLAVLIRELLPHVAD
jgi:hypothetical protein